VPTCRQAARGRADRRAVQDRVPERLLTRSSEFGLVLDGAHSRYTSAAEMRRGSPSTTRGRASAGSAKQRRSRSAYTSLTNAVAGSLPHPPQSGPRLRVRAVTPVGAIGHAQTLRCANSLADKPFFTPCAIAAGSIVAGRCRTTGDAAGARSPGSQPSARPTGMDSSGSSIAQPRSRADSRPVSRVLPDRSTPFPSPRPSKPRSFIIGTAHGIPHRFLTVVSPKTDRAHDRGGLYTSATYHRNSSDCCAAEAFHARARVSTNAPAESFFASLNSGTRRSFWSTRRRHCTPSTMDH